jgi:two-component system, LytTR family, response regulator
MPQHTYQCLLIDDEPHIIEGITFFINKLSYLQVKDATTSPTKAMTLLATNTYDIVFCDINMPEISGLEIVKANTGKAAFIMSTAYAEYAVDGFDLGVVDYLLKPFIFSRFLTAVQKAIHSIAVQKQTTPLVDYIFVKTEQKGKQTKINFADVDYVEGQSNYINFVCGNKNILTLMNMKDAEVKMSASLFLRVHTSFIIAINKVEKIEGNNIYLKGVVMPIPIGTTYKAKVLERLGLNL